MEDTVSFSLLVFLVLPAGPAGDTCTPRVERLRGPTLAFSAHTHSKHRGCCTTQLPRGALIILLESGGNHRPSERGLLVPLMPSAGVTLGDFAEKEVRSR